MQISLEDFRELQITNAKYRQKIDYLQNRIEILQKIIDDGDWKTNNEITNFIEKQTEKEKIEQRFLTAKEQ